MTIKLKLYPYQNEAVERIRRSNTLLADEPGLGKTVQALSASTFFIRTLIICPKNLKGQWAKECDVFDIPCQIVTCKEHFFSDAPLIIAHYEQLRWTEAYVPTWDLVVVDEAHRMKDRTTQRASRVKKIKARRKVALTATPMEKSPADLWSILNWLDPKTFGARKSPYPYWPFVYHFCETEKIYVGGREIAHPKITGAKEVQELNRVVSPYFLRRTYSEVAPQIPETITTTRYIPLSSEQQRLYDQMERAVDISILWDGNKIIIPNVLSLMTKLMQVTGSPLVFDANLSAAKAEWLQEWVTDHSEYPLLVLTRFRASAEYIHSKIGGRLVMGGMSTDGLRQDQRIVATIDSLGEGIDLPHLNYCVFYENHWSSLKTQQARYRIRRVSSCAQKYIVTLLGSPVDELVYNTVMNKLTTVQMVYEMAARLEARKRR